MPLPTEHSARLENPDKYIRFRRENDKFGKGIHAVWGILKNGKVELQSIRFDKTKFTVEQAKKWLKEHDYKPISFEPASGKSQKGEGETEMKMEIKVFDFKLNEVKEIERNGIKMGIIEGYASTFHNVDRGRDIVMPGAFIETIDDFKRRGRQVRMYWQHDRYCLMGGYPPEMMKEDSKGLFCVGEINLNVQKGQETYALAKQNVLTDFSIGYKAIDYDIDEEAEIRRLKKIQLWEISPVGEPMNPEAQVTGVKNMRAEFSEHEKIYSLDSMKLVSDFLKEREFMNDEVKALIVKIKQLSNRQNAEEDLQKASQDLDNLLISQKLDSVIAVLRK